MRKILFLLLLVLFSFGANAQNAAEAKSVLDKTAKIVGRSGGAQANFTISSSKIGSTSGTLAIKGRKFHASTPQAIVWYDGKTQWTYMKKTNEVNITVPSQAQRMRMNPTTFINLYKSGYDLSMTSNGSTYTVTMKAKSSKRSVQEAVVSINKSTYIPTSVKMRQGSSWTTISISGFKTKNQPNSVFTFSSKDFPQAEIIDLR